MPKVHTCNILQHSSRAASCNILNFHRIGWWEHLQESPINLMVKTHGFPVKIFPNKPIHWNFRDVPILRSSPDLPIQPDLKSTQASPVGLVDVGTWLLVPCCKPKISIQPHTRNIHVTTFRLLMSSLSDSWIHRYVYFPGVSFKKMTDC